MFSAYASPSTLSAQAMPPGATSAPTPSLRYWRMQRALTQQELADKAGVDLTSAQRGERNAQLRLSTIRRLAEALGIKPAQLMTAPPMTAFERDVAPEIQRQVGDFERRGETPHGVFLGRVQHAAWLAFKPGSNKGSFWVRLSDGKLGSLSVWTSEKDSEVEVSARYLPLRD
jgi:transcriptional regulator with XRE-family HTH domain